MTHKLLSNMVVLLDLIFIRDVSFDVAIGDIPLYSGEEINSFISICDLGFRIFMVRFSVRSGVVFVLTLWYVFIFSSNYNYSVHFNHRCI
jgi:hypothetical protein